MNTSPKKLTATDQAILRIVQEDARATIEDIAAKTGLSASSAQRRLQRLREEKVILGEVSIIDPKKLGLGVTLLVELELERDRPELMVKLHHWIARTPEVQEAWCITGRGDYTLVVVCGSIEEFDLLAERLMNENPNIRKFTTHVVLKTLKRGLALPLK
ncbi:Lrp/AsnC family transcriptional regulator [Ensifer sp. LCM 4579]|uniref:Lrp/AsnC family transcriptional regulator n=1 Tax=Ensifer sp. LCM 4579 TaxID=1848292 RepID=UPI0008DAE739|nr:Lrp/AsnC family transcriptional regulator [Ensifer sp. LCM 4579]OHV79917.1 AsnC family transcriptional regulator [Ensifer sp. LCM 4579]